MQRRDFLRGVSSAGCALWAGSSVWQPSHAADDPPREVLPVAAVVTEYRENTHADVIVGKILAGFDQRGGPGPALKLVGMYVDQFRDGDLSKALAAQHGFRLASTIDEALTLGSNQLQVRGVLNIGEHGDYPADETTGQVKYPRRRFFDGVAETFRRLGQVAPVFNDKHLAWNWDDARHMAQVALDMKIPFMAGSSLPVAWRSPEVSVPSGAELKEALVVGYGGLEAYGFHALEGLQCMVERRRGGETGVASVQTVQGEGIWQAEREGRWSRQLLDRVLAAIPPYKAGKLEENLNTDAAWYLIEYRDGLRATVAMANGHAAQFAFAGQVAGQAEPLVTWFRLQEDKPFSHFAFLLRAIDEMIHTGQPVYPVERTLLTTGILDAALHSLVEDHARLATPQLGISYQPTDWPFAHGEPPGP